MTKNARENVPVTRTKFVEMLGELPHTEQDYQVTNSSPFFRARNFLLELKILIK